MFGIISQLTIAPIIIGHCELNPFGKIQITYPPSMQIETNRKKLSVEFMLLRVNNFAIKHSKQFQNLNN